MRLRRQTEIIGINVRTFVRLFLEGLYFNSIIRTAELAHSAADANLRSLRKDFAVFQHEELLGAKGDTDTATLAVFLADYMEIAFFLFSHTLLDYIMRRTRSIQAELEFLEGSIQQKRRVHNAYSRRK